MSNSTKLANPMKVITGKDTRWSYANVWEAKSINGGTPKFSVSLIIPKTDTVTVQKIKAAIQAAYQSGMLFITLLSGRRLSYVKPKLGTNQFGSECITYEGIGGTKKWERLETYGPKLVENIVQATSRDILCYAMRTMSHCFITMHIHDELVIEARPGVDLKVLCEQMGRTPPWANGLKLRADGYETMFYKKD